MPTSDLSSKPEAFPVNPSYPYQLLKDRPITLKQYREMDAIAAKRGGVSAIQLLYAARRAGTDPRFDRRRPETPSLTGA